MTKKRVVRTGADDVPGADSSHSAPVRGAPRHLPSAMEGGRASRLRGSGATPGSPTIGRGGRGGRKMAVSGPPRPFPLPSPAVSVALLGKTGSASKVEHTGADGGPLNLGDVYLNDLSEIRELEISNTKARRMRVRLAAELRKPFHASPIGFQLENENVAMLEAERSTISDTLAVSDQFNHLPSSILRSSSKAALSAENVYLCEGYNELFNHIGRIDDLILEPNETKRVIFSMCAKLAPQHDASSSASLPLYIANSGDSSEEERMHLSETSCLVLSGRLQLLPSFIDGAASDEAHVTSLPAPEVVIPFQGQICRSLLRLDVKELHFDDCVPGGSFVKDFTVWNRSEIPLLFKLVSSTFGESDDSVVCTDYNSGYAVGDKTLHAAAYGHVKIRVTYRPAEVGERFFEVQVQNLHDARNVKILKIHAITNKEHHREGLSIKEPNGSYLTSGSKLDFGDCYTGIAHSKIILLRNSTEAALHVELTSDRPKEVNFELKLQQNRARASRAGRADEIMSPTNSNEESSRKGSLSPDGSKTHFSFSNVDGYALDSDEEVEDNEGEFFEEDFMGKRNSFEDSQLVGDIDDADDDFEFDRELRLFPRSPTTSPKPRRLKSSIEGRKKMTRSKNRKTPKIATRVRDLMYESGADSLCSSPEHNARSEGRKRLPSNEGVNAANYLVETIDLPPGVERTIVIWYTPISNSSAEGSLGDSLDGVDLKGCRLLKQTFRVSFRCFLLQGSWQQAQSRVYDRTLGKSLHIRARTCTSVVTVLPSVLHLGDCNIGELKSSSCMLTNHSELPTVVKPLVTSKVISTVPNDDMMLGPKQSTELKIEIIPRKTNPNYSRLISIINMKNKSNIPQICVRSSNMDAHHVIYHSLFYKLLTQSRSAFLNFEQVVINSVGIQVFDLENITNAPLHLNLQSSDATKVRLYYIKPPFAGAGESAAGSRHRGVISGDKQQSFSQATTQGQGVPNPSATGRQSGVGTGLLTGNGASVPSQNGSRTIRRRRSFGSVAELAERSSSMKRSTALALQRHLSKKTASALNPSGSTLVQSGAPGSANPVASPVYDGNRMRFDQITLRGGEKGIGGSHGAVPEVAPRDAVAHQTPRLSVETEIQNEELDALLFLFEKSRSEVEQYCHSLIPSPERELEIVGLVRERSKRLQTLITQKILVPLSINKERNIRLPAKSRQRIVAVFSPTNSEVAANNEGSKTRIEKHKVLITLPPGGNKKAVADAAKFDTSKPIWATSKHPFDTRPSVRELLLKSRVCRSVLNVNQKNINFGRIAASSKSSKRLVVQNMSAVPLVYSVEKTGSISSGFLQIKEGEVGVVKAFGTKEICFEFLPTLAGPFEEKLKIVNVQDPDNSVSVIIKAKVVKRETFKLLQAGKTLALGKCLVGERSDEIKIAIRNMSRKRREYVIQLDPSFSESTLRPTFYFSIDDTPATTITQAQEKKLDEELEKLEHKLRIAVTKKKAEKIEKLNAKISRVRALLSGEQALDGALTDTESDAGGPSGGGSESGEPDFYDSNSESEYSDSESTPRRPRSRKKAAREVRSGSPSHPVVTSPSPNTLNFFLEAEATCRIIAYAIFRPASSDTGDGANKASKHTSARGQKAKKRQLRRESTPMIGVGKFLIFEQQNKDVVKDLQYSAEVFLRTAAGENAFCQAVGRNLPPPPPMSHGVPRFPVKPQATNALMDLAREAKPGRVPTLSAIDILAEPLAEADYEGERRADPDAEPHRLRKGDQGLSVQVASDETLVSPSAGLLIPIEGSPGDFAGWTVVLSQSAAIKDPQVIDVRWNPVVAFRQMLAVSCTVSPSEFDLTSEQSLSAGAGLNGQGGVLLRRVQLSSEHPLQLKVTWSFADGAGFAPTTALSSALNRSVIDAVSSGSEVSAGVIEFYGTLGDKPGPIASTSAMSSLSVALVKSAQRALWLDSESIDLGEKMQNTDADGEFVIRNRSHQSVQFLLIASPGREQGSGNSVAMSPIPGGEITLKNPTGTIDAGSEATVRFSFKGLVPGQHSEQVLIRNLNDRTDTSTLTITARIVRPVYVRIPELDRDATGNLEVLNIGPCYVTPEMQDTAIDSPNLAVRFSKVHKLTLHSQVAEPLIVCASSNLKTQCYVYDDARLHREATNVALRGMGTIDLYVAFRPRLSADAFRTGSTRDLVGGIRVQLFSMSTDADAPPTVEEKKEMVAEFTVKFVGVAGVSIARVSPSAIDFGVEYNAGKLETCKMHEGQFELINSSKALPLAYRLFVVDAPDDYSDDDESLHVSLKHEKGEIPPGEIGIIDFRVMAFTNGLFRRRILVENIHYPGKVSFVDVSLFVDGGELECELLGPAGTTELETHERRASTGSSGQIPSINVGAVNVIRLEEELSDVASTTESEMELTSRKYRIYRESVFEEFESCDMSVRLTNTTEKMVTIRPFSTLPLVFRWTSDNTRTSNPLGQPWNELIARSTSIDGVRKQQVEALPERDPMARVVFFGEARRLDPNESCALSFQFARIATTMALPADAIEAGKLCPFVGMIGLQSFADNDDALDTPGEACTLKILRVLGSYGESTLQLAEKHISLGKIGYSVGWKSSAFTVTVRNTSDLDDLFTIANLPEYVRILQVQGADTTEGIHANDSDTPGWKAWKLPARSTCTLDMELVRSAQVLSAGLHNFSLRFLNLCNPHNIEEVAIRAQIVSSYVELVIDPESSGFGGAVTEEMHKHVAFLAPITVPPPPDWSQHASNFWFTLRNVFDEDLLVKLSAQTSDSLDRTLEFLLKLRTANTPLNSIVVAPGDSVDIRVVCHVLASARLQSVLAHPSSLEVGSGFVALGNVWLDVALRNVDGAAQREVVEVKGKLIPGKTFALSASSLHFFAAATEIATEALPVQVAMSMTPKSGPSRESATLASSSSASTPGSGVAYHLRNSTESFSVRNPSSVDVLHFVIEPVPICYPGLCLIEGANEADMSAMVESIQAVAVPSSGSIAPGESVKISVHLEEVSVSEPGLYTEDASSPSSRSAMLHKMRHHPSWRSNSWGTEIMEPATEGNSQSHMFLIVRDADLAPDAGVTAEIDIHLVLQQNTMESAKQAPGMDRSLIEAAFASREKKVAKLRKPQVMRRLSTHLEDVPRDAVESGALDNFDEFDLSSIRPGSFTRTTQLPVLAVRGCTPVEYSSLDNTRYVIDVGQHTVRNGGEVEWEITIESVFAAPEGLSADMVEYRLVVVDQSSNAWLQLSRDRGTLDRARSYQSVVLYFLRDVIGVYSTFVVLQNLTNPSDLKVIHVRLEVIADLNSLRSLSSGLDPAANLFRVLVSNNSTAKRMRRSSIDVSNIPMSAVNSGLVVDYSEVYYHKLYQNHSIVIENSSGLNLDFILSSNARPQEVTFSISPTSLSEVSTITIPAHGRMQIFLHFRPLPKPRITAASTTSGSDDNGEEEAAANSLWAREIELYVSCRLVKDFRETVTLHAICSQPQLMVSMANSQSDNILQQAESSALEMSSQPNFLGLVFVMPDATMGNMELATRTAQEFDKFMVVYNGRKDSDARLAVRNNSMFFRLEVDRELTKEGSVEVSQLERGMCAGRRPTLLVTIHPQSCAIFRVTPDVEMLWKHHQLWDHSVKEHVTLYNMKQFAEHYQVTLCFTCSNVASFYIPPNITDSYPFSALEDIIAKFLQNYVSTWRSIMSCYESSTALDGAIKAGITPARLGEILRHVETALDQSSPLSPRNSSSVTARASADFDEEVVRAGVDSQVGARDELRRVLQAYRALYFDFYYITDELVWYGVRRSTVRHSLVLADLAYGMVFNHDVFRAFVAATHGRDGVDLAAFPRLLLPWIRQLGHFLSYFPENQEATRPLRQLHDQLRKFELSS